MLSIAVHRSSVICSGPTLFTSRACDFLLFDEIPSTPRRSCSYSITFPIVAISRESSGGRMAVMSSMSDERTALAPGIGGLVLNSFKILKGPAL